MYTMRKYSSLSLPFRRWRFLVLIFFWFQSLRSVNLDVIIISLLQLYYTIKFVTIQPFLYEQIVNILCTNNELKNAIKQAFYCVFPPFWVRGRKNCHSFVTFYQVCQVINLDTDSKIPHPTFPQPNSQQKPTNFQVFHKTFHIIENTQVKPPNVIIFKKQSNFHPIKPKFPTMPQ